MKKIKVVYVDDEPMNIRLFSISFGRKFNVITALSGAEGLKVLMNHPDTEIVISDMRMPGLNGIEFLRMARKKLPDAFFCILTGYEMSDEINEAMKAGLVQKYFRKPFNIREIESAIFAGSKQG